MQERRLTLPHSPASLAVACLLVAGTLLLVPRGAVAQDVISGTVVSADDGETLPGVNVVVVGTEVGTVTNTDGEYTLEGVPASADSVQFSFVGFETQTEAIAGRSEIDVALSPAAEELGEVVVIGYGEESEALLTESIESVSAEEITETPIVSPEQALQGRVSGVQITTAGAQPNSPVSVRVRGVGTVGNTQPLYVIDGVPVGKGGSQSPAGVTSNALATIDPSNIESISVLKDASAASVYGVRAANGVVLIETKRGQSGAPEVSFNSYFGASRVTKDMFYEYNDTREYIELQRAANENYNEQKGLAPGDEGFQKLNPKLDPLADSLMNRNTDWLGEALRENAITQNYNLSVSGGTDDFNYYVSGGYRDSESNVPRDDFKRYSFRVNSSYDVTDWLRFGENFGITYTSEFGGRQGTGLATEAASMPSFFEIYDRDSSIVGNRYGYSGNFGPRGNTPLADITLSNPIARHHLSYNDQGTTRLLGNVRGRVELWDGDDSAEGGAGASETLYFESKAAIDFTLRSLENYDFPTSVREVGTGVAAFGDAQDRLNVSAVQDYSQVYTNTLNYNDEIGNHSIEALVGAEAQLLRYNRIGGGATDLVSTAEQARVLGSASTTSGSQGVGERNLLGLIGRVKYDYADKYLLTASVRRDGTSAFAPGNRWGTFPSFSTGWRIGEEPFMEAVPVISDLKLRGSWGQLGNSASVSPYAYVFELGTSLTYGSGESFVTAADPGGFTNADLSWETVETADFGVTGSLFEGRLTYGATYYWRETGDLLYSTPVPAVTGFGSAPINVGTILNTGVELEAGYFNRIGDFSFDISANLTTVKNEVTSLVEERPVFTSGGGYRTEVGQPIGYFYGYKTDGLYRDEEDVEENALPDDIADAPPQPGDVKFVDAGCDETDVAPDEAEEGTAPTSICQGGVDGEITSADRTRIGKTIPDFYYGLNLDLGWRNFDFSMLLSGEKGIYRHNSYRRFALGLSGGNGARQLAASADRWTPDNRDANIPRAVANDPNSNLRFSDLWVENASYLRMKNIQFGYSIPPSFASSVFKKARVYVSVSNVFTITPYNGLDPSVREFDDLNSVSNQLEAGNDPGLLPKPRTYRVGLQLNL